MSTPLRVTAVHLRDVLGAHELDLEPGGRLTVVSGRNGSGKSTVLSAIQAALTGGSLAKLQRVGAEGEEIEPEVVLVIDGPGHERYQVKRSADDVVVKRRVGDSAAMEVVGKPQALLTSLFDPRGSNPVAFLTAKDSDRALMLLEALPLKFDRPALLEAMGLGDYSWLPPMPAGLHPLEETAMIRAAVFDRRQGVNRDQKHAAGTADQLRRKIPAELPADPGAQVKALQADVDKLGADLAARETQAAADETAAIEKAHTEAEAEADKIAAEFNAFKASEFRKHERAVATWTADVEAKIAELRADLQRRVADALAATNNGIAARKEEDEAKLRALDATEAAAARVAEETRKAADEALAALANTVQAKREQLAALREQEKLAAAAKTLSDEAAGFERDADRLTGESQKLTSALEVLDGFRRRMAESLPIEGLSIEGKTVKVGGVPFDQLNTAQRIDIAVRVACLRAQAQRLKVLFVDGAEALDRESFGILVERLKAAGVQAFVARVDDADFTVTKDAVPA